MFLLQIIALLQAEKSKLTGKNYFKVITQNLAHLLKGNLITVESIALN
jgi:hypothetical protein